MAVAERDFPGDSQIVLADLADEVVRQLAPIGKVIKWLRPSGAVPVPDGWAICDGSPVAAGAHGFTGVGAFDLPDLRNVFVVGARDGADGDPGSPTVSPGLGGRGGAHTVDDTHRHAVRHSHSIPPDGGTLKTAHAVNPHVHSLQAHKHDLVMPIWLGPTQLGQHQFHVSDPADERLDELFTPGTHFWKNATGSKYSIRLDPAASSDPETAYIEDSAGPNSMDIYEQTSTASSSANSGNNAATTTGVGTGGSHTHGGATLLSPTAGAVADPFTDFQGGIRENRPAHVGMLRLMKLRHA